MTKSEVLDFLRHVPDDTRIVVLDGNDQVRDFILEYAPATGSEQGVAIIELTT